MPRVEWNEKSMATGVESLDEQHQELIRMLNELMEACDRGRGKEEIAKTLEFLGDYVKMHFSHEESIMDKCNCPAAAANKEAHAYFLAEVAELGREFEAGDPDLGFIMKVLQKVTHWLMCHIQGCDTELKGCVMAGSV